jgi:predicted nucleotidyltransferase
MQGKGSVVREVLAAAIAAVEGANIPYLVIGGIATATWGRPGGIRDVDLFVSEADAPRVLDALGEAGFSTRVADPRWLYKAHKNEILVDVIFAVKGGIHLSHEMIARGRDREVEGVTVRLISPEDLIVTLAASEKEDTDYWHDALGVIEHSCLDWNYLTKRAGEAPLRVLSLLLYALSEGLTVPRASIASIYGATLGLVEEAS